MNFDSPTTSRRSSDGARLPGRALKSERIRELADERGLEPDDRAEMAELGWPGVVLPEDCGGLGLGVVELVVIVEEMGYALAPSPLFSNTSAALALALSGTDEQRERWLGPLAAGEERGTRRYGTRGSPATPGSFREPKEGGAVVLDGEKVLVMDAASADFILVATADGRRHLVERGADGVTVTAEPWIDLTRRLYSVRFDGVRVGSSETLPAAGSDYLPLFSRVCVALAAE